MFFAFSPFRFRWALEASRWPQDGPRERQEGPKRARRAPRRLQGSPQERHKRTPIADVSRSLGAMLIDAPLFSDRWPPGWFQTAPKRPQEAPKSLKKRLQGPPNGPQEASRGFKTASRELPRRLPRDPSDAAFTTSPRANGRDEAVWAGGMSEAFEYKYTYIYTYIYV